MQDVLGYESFIMIGIQTKKKKDQEAKRVPQHHVANPQPKTWFGCLIMKRRNVKSNAPDGMFHISFERRNRLRQRHKFLHAKMLASN